MRRPEWPFWMLDRTSERWEISIEGLFLQGRTCIAGDAVSLMEVLECDLLKRNLTQPRGSATLFLAALVRQNLMCFHVVQKGIRFYLTLEMT